MAKGDVQERHRKVSARRQGVGGLLEAAARRCHARAGKARRPAPGRQARALPAACPACRRLLRQEGEQEERMREGVGRRCVAVAKCGVCM